MIPYYIQPFVQESVNFNSSRSVSETPHLVLLELAPEPMSSNRFVTETAEKLPKQVRGHDL